LKLKNLNEWLTLAANVGVLAGIVFLGLEIQQNTKAIERDIQIQSSEVRHGQIANSDYLPSITVKLNEVQGRSSIVTQFIEEFGFTTEEANRWWRYLAQNWEQNEADWIYRGRPPDDCPIALRLIEFKDNQLFYEFWKRNIEQGYIDCIESSRQ